MTTEIRSSSTSPVNATDPVDVKEAIRRTVSLDVIPWLDPYGSDEDQRIAKVIHNQLLNELSRADLKKRPKQRQHPVKKSRQVDELDRIRTLFIPVLNACTLEVLQKALKSIVQISRSNVMYKVHTPEDSGIGEDDFEWGFDDIPLIGDPLRALQNMDALRRDHANDQWSALKLLLAIEDLSNALIAPALEAAYRPTAKPWADRKVKAAELKVEVLKSTVPKDVQALVEETFRCFQNHPEGTYPLAVALPAASREFEFLALASSYENLARELRKPFTWVIDGLPRESRLAENGWRTYEACGVAFRVIACWLRALGNLNHDNKKCQYCYRHRMLKLRCGEHPSKVNDSPEARKGRAIYPIYVDLLLKLSEDSGVRNALDASLVVNAADWKPILLEQRAKRIPKALRRSVAILVVQIRRIQAVLGPRFESEVRCLYLEMEKAAIEAVTTTITDKASKPRADKASCSMNLKNFLILWFGRLGSEFSATFPGLKARGYDPYHPVVQNGNFLDSDVVIDLLRQRAWFEAESQFSVGTTLPDRKLMRERRKGPKPLSFREIGKEFGCSHETVRRMISDAPDRKYQKLKPAKKGFFKPD